MATIESTIKQIAAEHFPSYSYVFDNWLEADSKLEHLDYPAIVCVMPVSGRTDFRNGRVYDTENIALAFLDLAPRGADGEDNEDVYSRMKVAGARFIDHINKTRAFEPIDNVAYDVICENLTTIVSGIMYQLTVTQRIGDCGNV